MQSRNATAILALLSLMGLLLALLSLTGLLASGMEESTEFGSGESVEFVFAAHMCATTESLLC